MNNFMNANSEATGEFVGVYNREFTALRVN